MDQEALGTLWRWADPRLARSGGGGIVVGALLVGLLADLAVRSGGGLSTAIQRAADDARRQVCPT